MKFSLIDFGVFETWVNLIFLPKVTWANSASSIPKKGRNSLSLVHDMQNQWDPEKGSEEKSIPYKEKREGIAEIDSIYIK